MKVILRATVGVRTLRGIEGVRRDLLVMGFALVGLTFLCVTAFAAVRSPPSPPPGLTTRQVSVWNGWTNVPGFKNIWIIQFDKSILLSNSITLDVNGRSYRLDGKSSRLKPFLVIDEKGRRMVEGLSWSGQSAEGAGTVTQTDDGEFGGSFTLGKVQVYNIMGVDDVTFLVELDQTPPKSAEPPLPAASVLTPRSGAACSAANETAQSRQESVLFGPGTGDRLASFSKTQLTYLVANKTKAYPLYVNRLAVDSDVILVDIERKRYRFVGTNRCSDAPPMDFWNGKTTTGDRAEIHRMVNNVFAMFDIGDRSFTFTGSDAKYGVLWERLRTPVVATSLSIPTFRASPPPTPAEVEAQRAKEKYQMESRNVPTKAQMCADLEQGKQRTEVWLGLPQSNYARGILEKGLADIKARQLEIQC